MTLAETTTTLAPQMAAEIELQVACGAEKLDWRALCALARCSRRHADRLFRAFYFTSPARYMCDLRTRHAEALLTQGHDVLSAAVQSGFSGPGRLHDALVTRRGLTPGEVRQGAAGVRVRYGLFKTPIGIVVIAATPRGVCAIRLCSLKPPQEHIAEIRTEMPQAEFGEDSAAVQAYADQLIAFLERRVGDFHPDIDVHGTTFQREVWAELRRVRPGEVITYTELARRVGRPRAVRAVANACANNRVAIAIPCHRVLRKGGSLGGYAWGLEWKQKLLELEARMRKRLETGRFAQHERKVEIDARAEVRVILQE